jgi:GMP synthase (glutamine-hydrolysing)
MSSDRAASGQLTSNRSQIAILDFGSQYSHLIARRVRELNVFCELYSCQVKAEVLKEANIVGVILSGGPNSVYDPEAPHVAQDVWDFIKENKLPLLGICYGMQEMTVHFGGKVEASSEREYGKALVQKTGNHGMNAGDLFYGIDGEDDIMWMSHGDKVRFFFFLALSSGPIWTLDLFV